jgi:hypothetical protein
MNEFGSRKSEVGIFPHPPADSPGWVGGIQNSEFRIQNSVATVVS